MTNRERAEKIMALYLGTTFSNPPEARAWIREQIEKALDEVKREGIEEGKRELIECHEIMCLRDVIGLAKGLSERDLRLNPKIFDEPIKMFDTLREKLSEGKGKK